MKNKKGQDSGTLQNIILALLACSAVAALGMSYISGISINYGVSMNSSEYTVFNKFSEVNETLSGLTGQFTTEEGGQTEDSDVITTMITSGYGLIKLLFDIPEIFQSLVSSALVAMAVPPATANILGGLAVGVIVVMILFAALALVMKVRA